MKKVTTLSPSKCQDIVSRIQFYLYATEDEETGDFIWDPDLEINGADFIDYVANLMSSNGLAPKKLMKRR